MSDSTPNAFTLSTISTGPAFPNTRWTLVVAAGGNREDSRPALESLCAGYWYPIYAYIRRLGRDADTARDLTQDFFLHLLNGNFFERANPQRGRFRSFLLGSLRHFLHDEADRRLALKRGAGRAPLPFEIFDGETFYLREPSHDESPDRIFERRWARAVLDRVIGALRDEFVRHGRLDHFNALKPYLIGTAEAPYAQLAATLEISESALKSGIHRLRKRYKDALRAEVASTVADSSEVDEELRFLFSALSGRKT